MERRYEWRLCLSIAAAGFIGSVISMLIYHYFYSLPLSLDAIALGLAAFVLISGAIFLVSLPFFKKFAVSGEEEPAEERAAQPEKIPDGIAGDDVLHKLSELYEERNTVNDIIDNMAGGLVLISRSRKLLAVNHNAIKFLSAPEEDYTDEEVLSLIRNKALLNAIDRTLEGKKSTGKLQSSEHLCRYFLDPVTSGEHVVGATLFLLDVKDTNGVALA